MVTRKDDRREGERETSRNALHSQATRRAILDAAGRLFAERGYDSTTLRGIASEAQCSHTAIYLYFRDKEALLEELSTGPLENLRAAMQETADDQRRGPDERIEEMSLQFIRFCLSNRTMYRIFFVVRSTRVDDPEPELPINRLRNALFSLLNRSVAKAAGVAPESKRALEYSRIYFFLIHGIVATYDQSQESVETLFARLEDTFRSAIRINLEAYRRKQADETNDHKENSR